MAIKPRMDEPHLTQTISVTIRVTGPQNVTVETHGGRGDLGSYIAVLADHTATYVYDVRAARTYAGAWIDAAEIGRRFLPESLLSAGAHDDSHGIVIRAHGRDHVRQLNDPARGALAIRVGQVIWLVQDRIAYRDMTAAWRQVLDLAPIILARPAHRAI